MSKTPEHLEHIEHTQHAAHSHFDRNVAVTMAIVAAALACLTLLSHREHNEALQRQMEAGIAKTSATDEWNYYQAKNIREHEYEMFLALDLAVAKDPKLADDPPRKEAYDKARKKWTEQVDKYVHKDLPEQKAKAEELDRRAVELQGESHHAHKRGMRFDMGELFVELALVFCSLAVLTKRPPFWYTGLGAGVVGIAAGVSVWFLH